MKLRAKRRWSKGEMARTIVIYCIKALTYTLIWAMALKTAAVVAVIAADPYAAAGVDLSDVLIFAVGGFGGELLLSCAKRVFAKNTDSSPNDGAAG